jgi:phosphatidylglycerol lysyltransferase
MPSSSKQTVADAQNLLNRYGGEVDDYFKIWPPDKKYFFSPDDKAFLAYAVKYNIAVCLFDPIGPYASVDKLLKEFKKHCQEYDLTIVFIQTTNKYAKLYRKYGLRGLLIGADAVIDIHKFLDETLRNKYFRNINNRFTSGGFKVQTYSAPHSKKLIAELKDISDDWLKLPNHKEWKFLTGRFTEDYVKGLTLYVLRDKSGSAVAFATGLPSYRDKTASIDLIRRRRDSPSNSTDFLFIGIMKSLVEHNGHKYFNIGMSPIDGRYFADSVSEQFLILLYRSSKRIIGFKGLHQFKSKFDPEWEPRYVFYQGNIPTLIHMGLAIYRLMT